MKFSKEFKIIYWLVLVVSLSGYIVFRFVNSSFDNSNNIDSLVLIFWFALIVFPLIKEINILGVSFKREIEDVKREVRDSVNNLKMDLRNNVNVNPNINIYSQKASDDEKEAKIKEDILEEITTEAKNEVDCDDKLDITEKVMVRIGEKEDKAKGKFFDKDRYDKIKMTEDLIMGYLNDRYGEKFAPYVKLETSTGKKLIVDGAVFEDGQFTKFIEIKLISGKGFDNFKYIAGRYLRKLNNFGLKVPMLFLLVYESIDEIKALEIKDDLNFLCYTNRTGRGDKFNVVDIEFFKLDGEKIIKVEPKSKK